MINVLKTHLIKKALFLTMFIGYIVAVEAQASCQKYRQQGIDLYNGGNYAEALRKFQGAAKVSNATECSDLNTWITKTKTALQPKEVSAKPKFTDKSPISVSCTAKCTMPDKFKTVTEQILVKEASKRIVIVPTFYSTLTEKILVKPEYYANDVLETVTERLMVKAQSERLVPIAAVYESKPIVIEVCPQTNYFNRETKTIDIQKLVIDASVKKEEIPAEYRIVTKQRVKEKKGTGKLIPAQYATVTKQVVKTPQTYLTEVIPAVYTTVKKRIMMEAGEQIKMNIVCEENLSASQIAILKKAIKDYATERNFS